MGQLMNVVKNWMSQEGIDPKTSENPEGTFGRYGFRAELNGASYQINLDAHETSRLFAIFLYIKDQIPKDRRSVIAELLVRINWSDLRFGSLDLSMDTGILRYRTGAMLEGAELTSATITNMLQEGMAVLDKWHPSLMVVVNGGDAAAVFQGMGLGQRFGAAVH